MASLFWLTNFTNLLILPKREQKATMYFIKRQWKLRKSVLTRNAKTDRIKEISPQFANVRTKC